MKSNNLLLTATACLLAFCLASCSSSTSSNPPNNNSNNTPPNTMTVTVGGTTYTWLATAKRDTISGQVIVTIAGADTSGHLGTGGGLTLTNITTTGSYNVGTLNGATTEYTVEEYTTNDSSGNQIAYSSPITPGLSASGTIAIQQIDATTFKATFSGTLTKKSGSGGASTVTFTNGSVNATFL